MRNLIPTLLSYSIRLALDVSLPSDEMMVFARCDLATMRQLAFFRVSVAQ